MTNPPDQPLNPGDEAAPGTPGSGEDVCPVCQGSGNVQREGGAVPCSNCGGTGVVVEGIGGG
jgi:DnaJ-class molecular chaperone